MKKLSEKDLAVLRCLPVGTTSRITMQSLKIKTGLNTRAIYEAIERIRLNGVPVMASRQAHNGGYFIAETEEEKQLGIAQYKQQMATEQLNLSALEQAPVGDWKVLKRDLNQAEA